MESVGAFLASLLKELGIEERVKLESIQREWNTLFTGPLALHTYPVDIKNGELIINVDSPAWLQQLKFFKKDMLKKLHEYRIKELKFKHGRVYNARNIPAKKSATSPVTRELKDTDIAWIHETIAGIQDPELRESIRKAIEKALTKR
jgi:hypothetical protein